MCKDCVITKNPKRSICADSGCYITNFKECCKCSQRLNPIANNKQVEDVEDVERTTFEHICPSCCHVIAIHTHEFNLDEDEFGDKYQHYLMDCMLCGTCSDSRSVLPIDPRVNTY